MVHSELESPLICTSTSTAPLGIPWCSRLVWFKLAPMYCSPGKVPGMLFGTNGVWMAKVTTGMERNMSSAFN